MALDSPFGTELLAPIPSGKENGLTTPLPGIGTPALNTKPTQNESVGITWRGGGFNEATDSARPAQVDSVFDGPFIGEGMDQSSGGGSGGSGALDSPWTGNIWQKP
jgi:hypothetical protein